MKHQMQTYIVDGHPVTVSCAEALVEWMHAGARTQAADDEAYMLDVSERTVLQSGDKLRTGSAEEFVEDLVAHGLIKPL
jgi:hypothetical protein